MTLIANIEEIWKPIKGYEGRYSVSNHGRVWSHLFDRESKQVDAKKGYKRICLLRKDGKKCNFFVARLVAQAFLSDWDPNLQVNHIDGVVTNNHVSNLEMCTVSENQLHGYRIGLSKKWDQHGKSKLSNYEVKYIRYFLCDILSDRKIGKLFNVSGTAIGFIRHNVTYRGL